jgi:hypothetical protein
MRRQENRTTGKGITNNARVAIYYEIMEDVRTVIVFHIWRTDRR